VRWSVQGLYGSVTYPTHTGSHPLLCFLLEQELQLAFRYDGDPRLSKDLIDLRWFNQSWRERKMASMKEKMEALAAKVANSHPS
jgi:hypothetical protein